MNMRHALTYGKNLITYEKVHKVKETAEEKTDQAKELLASSAGASSTGEYKYGVELAPDTDQQRESDNTFAKIDVLGSEVGDSDFDVDYFRGYYDLGKTREDIVKKALSKKGRISYLWGGKSLSKKTPKSLDCSGFVQWVYHYVTGEDYPQLASTASVGQHYSQITKDELRPGDVGMKNPEGTCFVAADGEKFYSSKAAADCNRAQNKKIKAKIKSEKKDLKEYQKNLKRLVKGYIKDLKAGKTFDFEDEDIPSEKDKDKASAEDNTEKSSDKDTAKGGASEDKADASGGTEKASGSENVSLTDDKKASSPDTDPEHDASERTKNAVEKAAGKAGGAAKASTVITNALADEADTPEAEEQLIKAVLLNDNLSIPARTHLIRRFYKNAIRLAKEQTDSDIRDLKKKIVEPGDISQQIGHIGIYAGKNADGEDTWVHCTGGSKDTVVVTTESEYDGFKFYYSPLAGEKPMSISDIRVPSGVPEADYEVNVPDSLDGYTGHKTYERYTAIRAKSSPQYQLQRIASTDVAGFRKIQGRYLIAVGTGVTSDVGRYVDVVLENGTVIPCIVGDIKANIHTDGSFHIMTRFSRCVSEFIVDGDLLPDNIRNTGDVSNYIESWQSKVKKFIVYKDKVLR